jgi:hypothetical protein
VSADGTSITGTTMATFRFTMWTLNNGF